MDLTNIKRRGFLCSIAAFALAPMAGLRSQYQTRYRTLAEAEASLDVCPWNSVLFRITDGAWEAVEVVDVTQDGNGPFSVRWPEYVKLPAEADSRTITTKIDPDSYYSGFRRGILTKNDAGELS